MTDDDPTTTETKTPDADCPATATSTASTTSTAAAPDDTARTDAGTSHQHCSADVAPELFSTVHDGR